MKTVKEIFESHKGKILKDDHEKGICCGYNEEKKSLIIACNRHGWFIQEPDNVIVTNKNHPNGYWYIDIETVK